MTTIHTIVESPLGGLTVVAEDGVLTGLYFPNHWYQPDRSAFGVRDDQGFDDVTHQLKEYFAGQRTEFDLPMRADGDEFQRTVWARIARVPYGETTTYGDIALGISSTARDVGAAIGRNPLCVLLPCHRVVGRNGALTGYAGGLTRKRFLLSLEEPAPETRGQLW
jgi:methylated-DNA-[protein]-cysteine S-methyltransferase